MQPKTIRQGRSTFHFGPLFDECGAATMFEISEDAPHGGGYLELSPDTVVEAIKQMFIYLHDHSPESVEEFSSLFAALAMDGTMDALDDKPHLRAAYMRGAAAHGIRFPTGG